MKEHNLVYSQSATIQKKQYEPVNFFCSQGLKTDEDIDISSEYQKLRLSVSGIIQQDIMSMNAELIQNKLKGLRTKIVNGKLYISVTSIESFLNPIDFPPEALELYADRGTAAHEAFYDYYFNKDKKVNLSLRNPELYKRLNETPIEIDNRKPYYIKLEDCNPMEFIDKHRENIIIDKNEMPIQNDKLCYFGTLDIIGTYCGIPSIMDIKTSSSYTPEKRDKYFTQMAGYSLAINDKIEQFVILPIDPKKKVTGPIVTTEIKKYQDLFLDNLKKFNEKIGVKYV